MKKILIVDDEKKIRKTYSGLLRGEGFDVIERSNAMEASETLVREKVDLVLLDIKMPEVDGSILYEVMRLFHKRVKVIVTSVYPLDEQKRLIAEAADYHDKSQGIGILLSKINKVLGNGQTEAKKDDREKFFFKDIPICILSALIMIFLFPGCNFISFGHQKEAKEEKEIFGFIDGYNHRIKEAQGYLMNAEFNPGPTDGKMSRDTRKAIKGFQRAHDLNVSGFINAETWKKLGSYKDTVKRVNKKSDPLGYYSSTLEGVRELQQALKNSGFGPGPIDGKIGSKTKKAIMDFQSAKGLSGNGTIDSKTLEALTKYFTKK